MGVAETAEERSQKMDQSFRWDSALRWDDAYALRAARSAILAHSRWGRDEMG
jgi:hypothetical protein